jgi:hypothetical protein
MKNNVTRYFTPAWLYDGLYKIDPDGIVWGRESNGWYRTSITPEKLEEWNCERTEDEVFNMLL